MNDARSTVIGWTVLILAAGSGYYLARKDLNERRKEQTKKGYIGPPLDWREKIERDIQAGASAGNASETPTGASKTTTSPTPASETPKPPPNPKAPPQGS